MLVTGYNTVIFMDRQHQRPRQRSFIIRVVDGIFSTFFYPFSFPLHVLRGSGSIFTKVLAVLFSAVILLPVWVGSIILTYFASIVILQAVGVLKVSVPVSGPSMLPTLPSKGFVQFHRYVNVDYLRPTIQKHDIIVFANDKTKAELEKEKKTATGLVKRVIATAGDKVLIKDGFVYVNDEFQREPFILKPRSTFGSIEIQDCKEVIVPENKVIVFGDNRKISLDSRFLGEVTLDDIEFYLPYAEQVEEYGKNWRDTSKDHETAHESLFDVDQYVSLFNTQRLKSGVKPLQYQPKLTASAYKRAAIMLKYDDISFEATKSGYTMQKAFQDVGYSNITYGEFPIIGYYDAQELVDAFFERESSKNFLLGNDYQEIGVTTFVGEMHGCPVQIVVQHLAGYVPPNYSQATVNSWVELLNRLRSVQAGWSELKKNQDFYHNHRADVDRINEVIALRISRVQTVVNRMQSRQWLSEEEKTYLEKDVVLRNEQDGIAQRLNGGR